ncbi:MAG: M20 family metallopeptidase [Clostridia bacterium]|nr:M20 family metallopeptidase [Clostridia bacterium]
MEIKRIVDLIEERQNELYELLSSLVKINSENFMTHGNEETLARHIHKLCSDMGLESELYTPLEIEGFEQHPDYVDGRALENRYNVSARWRGAENVDELMLMGHIDTVPIGDLANWNFEPLSGEILDGKIFGRGACDDKYALATALFIIKLLKEEGFAPRRNLVFSAYCDEEYGGSHGALAASLKYPSNRIVNMDGRQNQIWNCASGGQEAKYFFHTKNTVDSAKQTAMAIPVILEVMEEFRKNRETEMEENPYYKGTIIPKTSLRYMGIKAGNAGMDLGRGEAHFTYYTVKTKEEIYAEFAEFEKILNERLAPLGIEGDGFFPHTRFFHYVSCAPDCEAITDFSDAMNEAIGKRPNVCGSCLSDLSVIGKYGSAQAFAYGGGRDFSLPGGAHQPNEFIECEKLLEYAKTIAAYVVKVL